jgi:hypothetical protein
MKKTAKPMAAMKKAAMHHERAEHHHAEAKKWIQSAIRHPGALHKELGVKAGEKIPAKKLEKATHSKNPTLARRARLAETLKGLGRGKK